MIDGIRNLAQHISNQYQLSLRAGFGPRKAMSRALRTYFTGF